MVPTSITAYAQVNATTRALYAALLVPSVWFTLIQTPNFDALLGQLDKTAYGPYLKLDRQLLTPRRTVYQLRWHITSNYEKLIRLTPEPGRQLILQLWRLYEIDNLKATLRGVETGASWDEVRHLLSPMFRYVTLANEDIRRMLDTGSVVRAVERIRHTPYYATLVHALARYEAEKNLFPLEVALDLDYRRGLWESVQNLKGTDHKRALQLIGTSIDLDNLLWAIRYRVYHHLSVQEIINYTLPFGYQVCDADIRALAEGADIITVIKRIYPHLEGLDEAARSSKDEPTLRQRQLISVEYALQRHLIKLCHQMFGGDPFHIGVQLAYLLLLEYELRDLITVVEAKASQLPIEKLISVSIETYHV